MTKKNAMKRARRGARQKQNERHPTRRERPVDPAVEHGSERKVIEGEAAVLHVLRTVVQTQGVRVMQTILNLTDREPEESGVMRSAARIAGTSWWLKVIARPPGELPGSDGGSPIPADFVVAVVTALQTAHVFAFAPEDLLPPSSVQPSRSDCTGDPEVRLRTALFMIYGRFGGRAFADPRGEAVHRRFAERVRAAVIAELARPGTKRPLVEIIHEVGGGPGLEAIMRSSPGGLTKQILHRALAGEPLS